MYRIILKNLLWNFLVDIIDNCLDISISLEIFFNNLLIIY